MKKFDTIYIIKSSRDGSLLKYASYVLAKDIKEAKKKVKIRNINEELQNSGMPYEKEDLIDAVLLFDKGHYKHCLHAIIFMSYVLTNSGRITSESVLNDVGLIHEMIHIITDCVTTPDDNIRQMLIHFQESYYKISH